MIKGINSSGRHLTVTGGHAPSTYVNSYSGAQGIGNVRYNTTNQYMEVYDGSNWLQLGTSYATIELNPETEELLEWARKKRDSEKLAIKMAIDNPTIADALETVKQAQDRLDIVMALTRVDE